jgi:hypothetical protein
MLALERWLRARRPEVWASALVRKNRGSGAASRPPRTKGGCH